MAKAPSLLVGNVHRITSGMLEGAEVTIVDNKPFPDGDIERRRKVTVMFDDGDIDYFLPRMLSDEPVRVPTVERIIEVPIVGMTQAVQDVIGPVEVVTAAPALRPIVDPMDERLDYLRPLASKFNRKDAYINRVMATGQLDTEFLLEFAGDAHRGTNEGRPVNLILKGDTQAGKTLMVEKLAVEWAKAMGLPKPMPIFTLSGSSGVTDYDLFGQTTSYTDPVTGREALIFLPGMADLAAQAGGILYLDEINMMAERVTSSLHPLLDHRHFFVNRNKPVWRNGQFMPEIIRANIDLWIIATYNEGYKGAGPLNEAFAERFRHLLWGYDENVEDKLLKSPALKLLAGLLRTAREAMDISSPVGTSSLQNLKLDAQVFGVEMAVEIFIGKFLAHERGTVAEIIDGRSVAVMLRDEMNMAAANDAAEIAAAIAKPDGGDEEVPF